jgi:hypothetical protein
MDPKGFQVLRELVLAAVDFEQRAAPHQDVQSSHDSPARWARPGEARTVSVAEWDRPLGEPMTVSAQKPLREKAPGPSGDRRRSTEQTVNHVTPAAHKPRSSPHIVTSEPSIRCRYTFASFRCSDARPHDMSRSTTPTGCSRSNTTAASGPSRSLRMATAG